MCDSSTGDFETENVKIASVAICLRSHHIFSGLCVMCQLATKKKPKDILKDNTKENRYLVNMKLYIFCFFLSLYERYIQRDFSRSKPPYRGGRAPFVGGSQGAKPPEVEKFPPGYGNVF